MEPYAKAYELQTKQDDMQLYMMGMYNKIAYEVVMAHFGAGMAGKKSNAQYVKEPFLQQMQRNKTLTEEEIQREVDKFFAMENARRINWKRNHKKKTE